MQAWVIRKTLPTHDHGIGGASTPTYLYWAGPDNHRLQTPSWVWISGLCPQVASFFTRTGAEAAAHTFAGPHWRTPDMEVINLHRSKKSTLAGPITPNPGATPAGNTPDRQ